jgi:SOS response regulatory protein OraA/RecX
MKEKEWGLTDEQVEAEIERLSASEAVALARREARLRYRRRQFLYQLRDLEKKGNALLKAGITREVLDAMYSTCDEEET